MKQVMVVANETVVWGGVKGCRLARISSGSQQRNFVFLPEQFEKTSTPLHSFCWIPIQFLICNQSPQLKSQVALLILPLVLVHSLAAPVPTFTETITLTTGILPILLAKLLFLKGQMDSR